MYNTVTSSFIHVHRRLASSSTISTLATISSRSNTVSSLFSPQYISLYIPAQSYSVYTRQSICNPSIPIRGPKKSGKQQEIKEVKETTKGSKNSKQNNKESAKEVTEAADDNSIEEEGLPEGKDLKSMLSRHTEYCRRELAKVRGATANPAMLDHISLEVYGETQVLTAVAQIMLKGPQLLVVNPFDPAIASDIEKAIRDADLGLNPSHDGQIIKVPVPKSSKESREANVKLISKIAEAAKTRIRRARQAALEKAKKVEGISEDEIRRETKVIEEQVQAATAEVAKLAEKKKLEVEAN